jgi:hypothetical protein
MATSDVAAAGAEAAQAQQPETRQERSREMGAGAESPLAETCAAMQSGAEAGAARPDAIEPRNSAQTRLCAAAAATRDFAKRGIFNGLHPIRFSRA